LGEARLTGSAQIALTCGVFLLAFAIAKIVCGKARYLGLVDVPNERSSHSRPTPRGGGLGIFIAVTLGVWMWSNSVHVDVVWRNVLIGAGAVALVGLWDDVQSVSVLRRFAVHLTAATFLVLAFPGNLRIELFPGTSFGGVPLYLLSCVGIVCAINMFNFMDGIDGLAASEAIFVTLGGALIPLLNGHPHTPEAMVCILISAACAGFLLMNWAPARIFMGDVGSGFLGFSIAALALWGMAQQLTSFWTWLMLGGVFVADAALTFFRRLFRGENVTSAHRMHAYQRLARRWSSHRRVSILMTAINCFWLLPLAILAAIRPIYAPLISAVALIPIGIAIWISGAGLPES
jgi:Fuc2NAc and GlcNAc transferase